MFLQTNLIVSKILSSSLIILLLAFVQYNGLASPDPTSGNKPITYKELIAKASDWANKDMVKSIAYCDEARALVEASGDLDGVYYICREQGYIYEQNNKLDLAIDQYSTGLEIAKKLKNTSYQLSLFNDLAIVNRKAANYQQTKFFHNKCLELAKQMNHLTMIEYSYHGLGYLYETIGDFEQAIVFYFKSLAIAEEHGAKGDVVISLQNISNTYLKIGDSKNALANIDRAYQMALELRDSRFANVLIDYGAILNNAGQYNRALEKLQAGYLEFEGLQQKSMMGHAIIHIIDVYLKQGSFKIAQEYLDRARGLEGSMANQDVAQLGQRAGDLFQKLNQPEKAKEAYLKSLSIANQHEYRVLSEKNNYKLYQLYTAEGNFKSALGYLEESIAIKDALLGEKKNRNIAELQFKYDSEKNEKEIQTLKLRQNKTIFGGVMLLAALLFGAMIYNIQVKAKSNQKLVNKNEEIQNQNIQLIESNEVLSQYAYVAAHDLKEPLRNIGNFINLLQRRYGKDFNEEANEYMTFVKEGAKRMNNLLKDLLEYSTVSSQKKGDEKINIRNVIENVVLDLSASITEKNAKLIFPDNTPNMIINKFHLQQLMQNLIGNGLKFCETAPKIVIDVQQSSDEILITVEDNGIGMKKEYENKVFNLFQRLHKNDKNFEGNGIGLTICKNIVSKYNGKIWFEPVATGGTKFFMSFPQEVTNKTEADKQFDKQVAEYA